MAIKFVASVEADVERIQKWTDLDEYHRGQHNPSWWLTGNGLLAFALYDDQGVVFYVRIDAGDFERLSVQFAPLNIVPKTRLVRAMLKTLPKLIELSKQRGSKGFIFSSVSPTLISFMKRAGFVDVGDGDFSLTFGE